MNEPTFLSSVLARLSAVRFPDLPAVAEGSGVPESTVRKLRYGEVKNPRVHTVQALHDYFERTAASAIEGAGREADCTAGGARLAEGVEHA
ncbi:hypothetical protein MXL91_20315 [Achromobacter ruhlandii]|uniref:hypothetical protein n=1 Tax=Achromobacter ruhlandii TaxID=72557 RepID=UPI002DB85EA6|nr:hypothetical protein [Achromobacter ruhlandii]MEB6663811.1 hypothetical protein [Achromobacter ruhlandii]